MNVDGLAFLPIFAGVLNQVFENLDQFIPIPENLHLLLRHMQADLHIQFRGQRRQAVADMAYDGHEIDHLVGREMSLQFQAGQRKQVIDEAAHPVRLFEHNGEKPLLGLGVAARRALHGLDETA